MTFSICATDKGAYGVAIATYAIAVGSTAPFVCPHGAVCTQAMTNTPIGVHTVNALQNDEKIDSVVSQLLAADEHRNLRQVHGIDQHGTTVTKTGTECIEYAGDRTSENYTIAGNMLTGECVLEAVEDKFREQTGKPLIERLLAALNAGEKAGGDKRGPNAQSAAVAVYDPDHPRIEHDLRVDEHTDAVTELIRIYNVAATEGESWMDEYPELDLQRHPHR
ncbi:DUF1028 domain-containing protein [Halorubraceae archaeon YAN]|nr:DUF1028 domain-containing protein [Halorubraceae archaeon YAN]